MTNLATLKFYVTPPHGCSYLDDREASSLFMDPAAKVDSKLYGKLSAMGFRRSGNYLYRPHCGTCQACVPVRVPVEPFRMRRVQRRIWQKNSDLTVVSHPPEMKPEHYRLYRDYITERHRNGDMYPPSMDQYESFLINEWGHTRFHEFRSGDRILAVAVVDHMPNGLSAVYTFFDPAEMQRSLGTYSILWQIEEAKRLGLPAVYLGYWIRQCRKMNYKAEFRPIEMLINDEWVETSLGHDTPGLPDTV